MEESLRQAASYLFRQRIHLRLYRRGPVLLDRGQPLLLGQRSRSRGCLLSGCVKQLLHCGHLLLLGGLQLFYLRLSLQQDVLALACLTLGVAA